MKEYLSDLAAFLAGDGDEHHDLKRKVDLLGRTVSNLIDEVLILRSIIQDVGVISEDQWREMYSEMKMNVMFSSVGLNPPSVFKFRRFFMNPQETAAALIPDEAERSAKINELSTQT